MGFKTNLPLLAPTKFVWQMRLTWVSGNNAPQQVQYGDGSSETSQVSTFTRDDMCSEFFFFPCFSSPGIELELFVIMVSAMEIFRWNVAKPSQGFWMA